MSVCLESVEYTDLLATENVCIQHFGWKV